MNKRKFRCAECDYIWEVKYGVPRPNECPKCTSINIHRVEESLRNFYRNRRQQRGKNYERCSAKY